MSESVPTAIPLRPLPLDLDETIDHVLAQADATEDLVRAVATRGLSAVAFVGCGGSLTATVPARFALERLSRVPVLARNSDDFRHARPALIDESSLVITVSHTGATAETLAAADAARAVGATVIGICRLPDAALAEHVDLLLTYRSPEVVTAAEHLLLARIAYGVIGHGDAAFDRSPIEEALTSMAQTYREALEQRETWAATLAATWAESSPITVLGSGPNLGAAQALAQYYLQEMQWIDAAGLHAGDFLHGPFETVQDGSPVLVLVGEDATRPVAERAVGFLDRFDPARAVLDSRDLVLSAVPDQARPHVTPFILDALTVRLAEHFEHARDHSLDTRRYMSKVAY